MNIMIFGLTYISYFRGDYEYDFIQLLNTNDDRSLDITDYKMRLYLSSYILFLVISVLEIIVFSFSILIISLKTMKKNRKILPTHIPSHKSCKF
jgi:hypothetical protein